MSRSTRIQARHFVGSAVVWCCILSLPCVLNPVFGASSKASAGKKKSEVGRASWYGKRSQQGKETASGEKFDAGKATAAHPTLPLGTKAKVTNLETGKSTEVIINDRGPHAKGRKIDLSKTAAEKIGMKKKGTGKVKIEPEATPGKDSNSASPPRH